MKKTIKLLSLLLALVMAASAMCLSALAESSYQYKYKKVTLIGDSIATALRMEWRGEGAPPADIAKYYKYNENSNTWTRTGATHGAWVMNSYPARVVEGVGLSEKDFYNYGREAFSSIEFRRLLDKTYTPSKEDLAISDAYYEAYGADQQGRNLPYLQKQVVKDLAKSDLVLVGIGSNDVFSYAMSHYSSIVAGLETTPLTQAQRTALEAIDGVVSRLVANGQIAEAWATIMNTAQTVNALEETLIILVKVILQGVQKFITNWDQIINKIHEYNPDATVMAVGLFNATEGLYLTDSIKLDVGQIMAPIFNTMNRHMQSYAKKTGYYTYVDATKTDHPAWPSAIELIQDTEMIIYYLMICTHPTYDGQVYIAEQIMKALPEKDKVEVKETPTRWVKKNPENGKWYCYRGDDIEWSYTGIAKNENGWWRIVKGEVDFGANSIYKNEYGWWKCTNGKVTFDENSIYKNENGWWKCTRSKVTFKENGIFSNKNGTWYVTKSYVDFNKNGKVKYNGKTYTVKNGKVIA